MNRYLVILNVFFVGGGVVVCLISEQTNDSGMIKPENMGVWEYGFGTRISYDRFNILTLFFSVSDLILKLWSLATPQEIN